MNSFWRLVNVDPGFHPEQVLLASLDIPSDRYDNAEKKNAYRADLLRRVAEVPGVVAVGAAKTQPLQGGGEPYEFTIPGRSGPDATMSPASGTLIVSPGYVSALGIPLLRGRGFDARDELPAAPAVMMINQAAARR